MLSSPILAAMHLLLSLLALSALAPYTIAFQQAVHIWRRQIKCAKQHIQSKLLLEYRYYESIETRDIDTHVASCKRVFPAIKPNPVVKDNVEDWYATKYQTFRFFNNRGDGSDDEGITITVREPSFGCGKLGHEVWIAGIALSCYLTALLTSFDKSKLEATRVLELGAGLGLPSCLCRELGVGTVHATDYWEGDLNFGGPVDKERLIPHMLFGENLEFNVVQSAGVVSGDKAEKRSNVSVDKLDWYSEADVYRAKECADPSLIVASDVVYYAEDAPPLARALETLLDDSGDTKTKREILLFLSLYNERKGLQEFREMITSRPGWNSSEEKIKLCMMNDELDSFKEEYSILLVKISN